MADDNVTLTPTFIVYINGTRLGVDHEASVRQILVKDQLDAPSTCQIVLSDLDRKWADSPDFDMAQSVSVLLGFKDAVEEVFCGEITRGEIVLKKQADASVILDCCDKMHRLYRARKHRVFNEMTDGDILSEIAGEYGLAVEADDLSLEHTIRVQEETTDYEFLRRLAGEYHYRFWIREDTLYMKRETGGGEDVVLEWGKTLLDFRSAWDTGKLITEVEVVGWDNMTGVGFSGIADQGAVTDRTGGGELGFSRVAELFGDRRVVVKDHGVRDQQSAEERAAALLSGSSYAYTRAQAVCEGDNRIRSGGTVEIKEASERFSGPYLVRRAVHNFHASSGYRTTCELERNTDQ